MPILRDVLSLRRVSFYLFLVPSIGLVGSILILNILVSFKYQTSTYYDDKKEILGKEIIYECNEENNFCLFYEPVQGKKLDECNKFIHERVYVIDETTIIHEKDLFINDNGRRLKKNSLQKNIQYKRVALNKKSTTCIKNSNFYFLYQFFPYLFDFIDSIKTNKKSYIATSYAINPLVYGEVSISNVVKSSN